MFKSLLLNMVFFQNWTDFELTDNPVTVCLNWHRSLPVRGDTEREVGVELKDRCQIETRIIQKMAGSGALPIFAPRQLLLHWPNKLHSCNNAKSVHRTSCNKSRHLQCFCAAEAALSTVIRDSDKYIDKKIYNDSFKA